MNDSCAHYTTTRVPLTCTPQVRLGLVEFFAIAWHDDASKPKRLPSSSPELDLLMREILALSKI